MNAWMIVFATVGWLFALVLFVMLAFLSASVVAMRAEVVAAQKRLKELTEAGQTTKNFDIIWKKFTDDYGHFFKKND